MITHAKIRAIEDELEMVNHQIDMKIIVGRPYKRESLRHRELVNELKQLKKRREKVWFNRLAHTFASIVF